MAGMAVGQRVLVGVGVTGVAVGQRVLVGETVGTGTRVFVAVGGSGVGEGPKVAVRVTVDVLVRVAVGVLVRVGVLVLVGIGEDVDVRLGDGLGGGVGASPSTIKRPEMFQTFPTKICTSYSPGSHCQGSGFQSVNPKPPVPPSQGLLSKKTSSVPRYHNALH